MDLLIRLKKEYGKNLILLRGNHELMFLDAIKLVNAYPARYDFWMKNGGLETHAGYMERAGWPAVDPWQIPRYRLGDIVPKEHIKLIEDDMVNYYETDEHIFVHAACNPDVELSKQDKSVLTFDRSMYKAMRRWRNENIPLPQWDKTIITGHNTDPDHPEPFISSKYMMLDCSGHGILRVVEINSMECYEARKGNGRLVKYQLKES